MHCTVNGEPKELEPGTTLKTLIESLGLGAAVCAAEVDKALVPSSERDTYELREGQRVEIVTLIGGG